MVVGLGIDVTSVARHERALARFGERFWQRILSPGEQRDLAGRTRDRATALAGRFAAKEAAAKALGVPPGLGWHEVEVRRDAAGAPRLVLGGRAAAHAAALGVVHGHVSLTHDAGVAAAVVVLEGRAEGRAP